MLKDGELKSEEFMNDAILAYQGMVLRVALNQTRNMANAEDVVQDVFIKLVKTRASFRDEEHLRAWSLRVAVNQCRDLSRKAWNRHVDVVPNPVEAVVDVEDDGFSEVADHPVWRAMERMAEADRLVLIFATLRNCPLRRSSTRSHAPGYRCGCDCIGRVNGFAVCLRRTLRRLVKRQRP